MSRSALLRLSKTARKLVCGLFLFTGLGLLASSWPQYRGPTTDGVSTESVNWPANGPTVLWTNSSLTNGFSVLSVSQGRAFAMISRRDANGALNEYCAAVDAQTGSNLWATPIDLAPWDPTVSYNGGVGAYPYNTGDGPRVTPSVAGDRVLALSGLLHLVCMNTSDGSIVWSNDLVSAFGASTIPWENAASPCVDNDLIFINLNTALDNRTLAAFRISDGSLAWSSENETVTHTTPLVATIEGVRQVIFATQTGLVSLDRTTGTLLWKYTYPFFPISTSMGATPVVYSNIVYCTTAYGRGAAAARLTLTDGTWNVEQLYYRSDLKHRSIWMSPVCLDGFIYSLCGENSTFLTTPLNCIELATGDVKWSTNNFGMGGLILVNTNLLVLTEDGQLVLVQPSPDAYLELGRYQAFQFSAAAQGKCWNSPSFSDGRIYARSTRGAICLDVSAPPASPLRMLAPAFGGGNALELIIGTADGTPLSSIRLAAIQVRASDRLDVPRASWSSLTNSLALDNNGLAHMAVTIAADQPQQFYTVMEQR